MKIAAYLDRHGDMAGLYTAGRFQLYEKDDEHWILKRQVPLEITAEMNIPEVKQALREAVVHLEDCKTLLSAEVRGLLYSLLQEEMGFRTWKSQGSLHEQLDNVARNELDLALREALAAAEAEKAAAQASAGGCAGGGGGGKRRSAAGAPEPESIPQPECLGEGRYRLDLEAALKGNKELNSRQVLIPFLENTVFCEFEILCDHVPRWFSHKLDELNLRAESEELAGPKKGLKLRVLPGPEAAPAG
ncbi:Fe-only nitrogenase accessory protein AnfO [Azotobacter vinelandii]